MWTAFPPSDYYRGSAPSDANSRRRTCPPTITNAGRATPDGSHVHHQTARQRRRPAIPLRPRHAYPAALQRGLPTGDIKPARKSPANAGVHRSPAQIRQVRAGGSLRGVRTLGLTYTFPSRLPNPSRLGSSAIASDEVPPGPPLLATEGDDARLSRLAGGAGEPIGVKPCADEQPVEDLGRPARDLDLDDVPPRPHLTHGRR